MSALSNNQHEDMANRPWGKKTAAEKEGDRRRLAEFRQRLRDAGQRPREVWATDSEIKRLREILATWRGIETTSLNRDQRGLARLLLPGVPRQDIDVPDDFLLDPRLLIED